MAFTFKCVKENLFLHQKAKTQQFAFPVPIPMLAVINAAAFRDCSQCYRLRHYFFDRWSDKADFNRESYILYSVSP